MLKIFCERLDKAVPTIIVNMVIMDIIMAIIMVIIMVFGVVAAHGIADYITQSDRVVLKSSQHCLFVA